MSDPEDQNPEEGIVEDESQVNDSQAIPGEEEGSEVEDPALEKSNVSPQEESDKDGRSLNPDKSLASNLASQRDAVEGQINQSLDESFKGESAQSLKNRLSQNASKKSIARSESVGSMLPEKERNIKKFIQITEKLVASKNEENSPIKIAYDEVSSNNLNFDPTFVSAFIERLTSDFKFETNSNVQEEVGELLRIKGLTDGETTGQFQAFFPILVAGLKNDVAGRDVLSSDIIEYITVSLFKESEGLVEESGMDTLSVDQFRNTYCDALEQKVIFFPKTKDFDL